MKVSNGVNKFFVLFFILVCIFIIQGLPVFAADSSFMTGLKTTAEGGAGYPEAQRTGALAFFSKMIGSALTPIFFGVVGMLSLIYAGYKWMMSRGNEQDVELAKTIITNTIIAMVVALSAYAIVNLIIKLWVNKIIL